MEYFFHANHGKKLAIQEEFSIAGELSCKSLYDATLPGELCFPDDDLTELECPPNYVQEYFASKNISSINSTTSCSAVPESSNIVSSTATTSLPKPKIEIPLPNTGNVRRCLHCEAETTTTQWRNGLKGPRMLCNACGVPYKSSRLESNHRPATSPKFFPYPLTNSHQKDDDLTELECRTNYAQEFPASKSNSAINLTPSCSAVQESSAMVSSSVTTSLPKPKIKISSPTSGNVQKCLNCETETTSQWRNGPKGCSTLCNACGVRYKPGRLGPNYRPATSPKIVPSPLSNSHQKDDDHTELECPANYAQEYPASKIISAINSTPSCSAVPESSAMVSSRATTSLPKPNTKIPLPKTGNIRRCLHCGTETTPQWRSGPKGPSTLCNACGVRYKSGRLGPNYRPATSPKIVPSPLSNSHQKDGDLTELDCPTNYAQEYSASESNSAINSTPSCSVVPESSTMVSSSATTSLPKPKIEIPLPTSENVCRCLNCETETTPQWMNGPKGPSTLCNACGVRYKSGQLEPNYRPATSPKFVSSPVANSLQKSDEVADMDLLSSHVKDSISADNTAMKSTTATSAIKTKRKRSRSRIVSWVPVSSRKPKTVKASSTSKHVRKCLHCETENTPQWRNGPMGPKTLCNACGVRYKSGRLVPEYRPASSPTFVRSKHSNSHRMVLQMRQQREGEEQQSPARDD